MNAMAYDIGQGLLMDPLGGWDDMKEKVVRCPGVQALREDPLRMLKAIRHLTALPNFVMAPEVWASITELRGLIRETAAERIKYGLDLIVLSKNTHRGIEMLADTGLLFEIISELMPLREMDRERGLKPAAFDHTVRGFKYMSRALRFCPLEEKSAKQVGYALLFHDLGKARTYSYDQEKDRVHFFHHERYSREMAVSIMERLRFRLLGNKGYIKPDREPYASFSHQ